MYIDPFLPPLEKAMEKQRLLFLAVSGLQAPGIDCKLMDDEILGLTGCIAETIDLIQDAIDQVEHGELNVTPDGNLEWQMPLAVPTSWPLQRRWDVIDRVEHAEPNVTPEDMRWQIEQETFFAIHKDYTEPPLFDALNAEVLRLANLPESAGKKGIQILLDAKANIDKQVSVEG